MTEIAEPLAHLDRAELQLKIMRNIEHKVMALPKRNGFRFWWDSNRNWARVQELINNNTSKAGSVSSAQQCAFMGVNPEGRSFFESAQP